MIVKEYSSTNQFSSTEWELFNKGNFYFGFDFLKIVEQSKINDAELKFLTFSENGECKGAAVLSYFILHLDLLSGDHFFLRIIKKMLPGALKVPVVCCGLPVSFGQNHFCVLDEFFFKPIVDATNKAMEKFARNKNCTLLAWKEFPASFDSSQLEQLKYLRLLSLPDTLVNIPESGSEKYLSLLRSPYRRKMKRTINRLNGIELDIAVTVKPFMNTDVEIFYSGYHAVMKRTKVKLEIYPKLFFELLASQNLQTQVLTVSSADETVSALLIPDIHALNFILVSKEKESYKNGLYSELLRAIIIYGLTNGFNKIKMGQTSYYSKMTVGAEVENLYFYLYSKKKIVNFALNTFREILFPKVNLPEVNALKKNEITS
jgi:hypothetical protein